MRRYIAVLVVGAAAVAVAITVMLTGGSPTDSGVSADRSNVFGHPGVPSAQPVPTGRPAAQTADFASDPCAVATVEELGVALAQPFQIASGTLLRRDRPPATTSGGCRYTFTADGTDTSEVYHLVTVAVAQVTTGGPALLSACLAEARTAPHGPVQAGDQACLGAGSTVVMRLGTRHYTVSITATPPRADRTDEETDLAPLAEAAAKLFATRLPRR